MATEQMKPLNIREIADTLSGLLDNHLRIPPTHNVNNLWQEHVMIRGMIDYVTFSLKKLNNEEEEDALSPRGRDDVENFLAWCWENDIQFPHVDLVECPDVDGYGLKANKDIPYGEPIVCVPRKAMLSSELAETMPHFKQALEEDSILKTMDNIVLSILLASEKLRPNSPWKPYIKMLPRTFRCPIFYSIEELKKLKPSPVFEEAILFYRNCARQFCYFYMKVVDAHEFQIAKRGKRSTMATPMFNKMPFTIYNFTFDLYRWAVACVSTRVNIVPVKGSTDTDEKEPDHCDGTPALIPMLDMANHELADDMDLNLSVGYHDETDRAGYNAHRDFLKDEWVSMNYGKRSNADHLLNNGFVPEGENKADTFKLKLPLMKSDKNYYAKVTLLGKHLKGCWKQGNVYRFDITADPNVPFDENIIIFLKVFLSDVVNDEVVEERNPELEKRVATYLRDRFGLLIGMYKDTKKGETMTERDIERLHKGELQMLNNAKEYCESWLHRLEQGLDRIKPEEDEDDSGTLDYSNEDEDEKKPEVPERSSSVPAATDELSSLTLSS